MEGLEERISHTHVAYPTYGKHHQLLCDDSVEDAPHVVMLIDARAQFRATRTVAVDCKACIRHTARTLS